MAWLLLDERPGNRNQCLGVAEALGIPFEIKELAYTALASLPGASFHGLDGASRERLRPPWPDIVIAAGRKSGAVARAIKRRHAGPTFLAQIMHPGGAADFDLIAVPTHDRRRDGANVLRITGAPHPVTPARLKEEAETWRDRLQDLPCPRIALIVGGSNRHRPFTAKVARELGRLASTTALGAGGSLLVSTSRRTGSVTEALLEGIDAPAHIHRWGEGAENPYFGYLALADAVVVTGDSVSMCSEACAAPAPVYIYAPPALIGAKYNRLHQELFAKGYARPFVGEIERWTHPPLNAAPDIAAEIRRRLGL